jgi:hypothetical protein
MEEMVSFENDSGCDGKDLQSALLRKTRLFNSTGFFDPFENNLFLSSQKSDLLS